jgi:hypothetical protein
MTLNELFELVVSNLYDAHFVVFEDLNEIKRFPLKKPNSLEDFYDICEKSLNIESYSINSDDYNITGASYIDSYYKKTLLNE